MFSRKVVNLLSSSDAKTEVTRVLVQLTCTNRYIFMVEGTKSHVQHGEHIEEHDKFSSLFC